ncbi:MAG: hypothetical protein RLZZ211_877 [Bacteroidota bacterium]|jgi:hypothetical protein
MNNPVKDPLDKLFASLNDAAHESPSAAFIQDLEARLDALEKKRRKPFFAWWIFSALGAVVLVSTYFIFVPNRAKTKVPNKSTTHAQSNSLSASKSTSSTISASSLASKTNASPPKSFSINTSSAIASTKLSSANSFSTSTAISSLSSSIAASSTKDSDVQQETYMINPILLSDEHEKDSVLIVDQPAPVLPKEVAPTKKRVQHLFGLQFGVSAIFSSFEADDVLYAFPAPYTAKQIREWRELGERNTSSWDFNLRYQCQFARWGFQTGLNYLEWGEQYKYEVISVEGTNRYQYVQVPLGLSYRIPLQKLTLQPAIGVGLGYGMQRNGSYILPQNNGVALVESRKFVLNAYAQCELIYQVSEQLQFSVSPIYRYAFGQVVSDPYVKNKYQSLGLLTGFMFNF